MENFSRFSRRSSNRAVGLVGASPTPPAPQISRSRLRISVLLAGCTRVTRLSPHLFTPVPP